MQNPDFILLDTITISPTFTVDKCAQFQAFNHIWYIPCPHRFDLWHFDLVKHTDKLIMVASEEKNDVIMLAESSDGNTFHTHHYPLINNHFMENYVGYRQYYYKPTAVLTTDTLHVLFTANDADDSAHNQLFHSYLIYD